MVRIRQHAAVAALALVTALPSLPAVVSAQTPYPCPYWVYAGEYYDVWDASRSRIWIFFVRGITRDFVQTIPSFASYTPDGGPLIDITGTHRWVLATIYAHCYTIPDPTVPSGTILIVQSDRYGGWAEWIGGGAGGGEMEGCEEQIIYDPESCEDWRTGTGGGSEDGSDGGSGDGGGDSGSGGGGGEEVVEFQCELVYYDDQGNERWICEPVE